MEHHHHHHHNNHSLRHCYHHQRHLPPLPFPPLPSPPFPDDIPYYPLRHLPPPPSPSRVTPFSNHPSISSHHYHRRPEGSFVNSTLHHHHPTLVYSDRLPIPPPIYVHDVDDFSYDDRRRFVFREPSRVRPLSPVFHRQVDFHDCLSPFVDRFSRDFHNSRFTDGFDIDHGLRLRCFDEDRMNFDVIDRDEVHGVRFYNERRSIDVVERDELRRNVIYDDWRSMNDFEREGLLRSRIDERRRIMDDLEKEELFCRQNMIGKDELLCGRIGDERRIMNNGLRHNSYHSGVLFKDDFVGGQVVDTIGPIRDDVEHPPFEFRSREIEANEKFSGFYEEEISRGLRVDRGRRERVRAGEDLEESYDHNLRKNSLGKKSAFLRLQPAIQHTNTFKNRLDNTTLSPHKGKGINVESLGHRSNEAGVESPVDLDVSFKSKALVTKAIIRAPSSSEVDGKKNFGLSDVDTKIVSESPLRARRSRNCGNNSPVPKKEEKQTDNQVRVSPILMKVGIRKVAEVPDNSSKSSSSGCSSLSGGGNTSVEGEVLSKDDKKTGFCKASLPSDRKKRKGVNIISRLSASVPTNSDTVVDVDNSFRSPSGGSMSDASGSLKLGCVQDEPHITNLDDAVTKSAGKRSSDIDSKKGGGQDQGSPLVLVGSVYVEGSSEPVVVSVGDNVGNIDICHGRTDSHASLAVTNSITCDVDASSITENRAYMSSSNVNVYKAGGLLPKCDIIGEQFRDVLMEDDDDESVRRSVDEMKLLYSRSIDVSDGDILSTDRMKIRTISDFEVTNGIQDQQSTSADSILVNDESRKRRKLSQKAGVSLGGNLGHLALSSVKENILSLDRKRKVGIDVCGVDPKDYPCNCSKKRKSIPVDSVFIETCVSESCDLCASANALKSITSGHLYSVKYTEQAAQLLESSNSLLTCDDVVDEETNNLLTVTSVLGDISKAEVQHKDSHSSVEGIAQSSFMAESGCNKKDDNDLIGAGKCHGNELTRSDSEAEMAKNCQNRGVHCIRPNHAADFNNRPLATDMECESNITVERSLSDCPFLCTEPTQEIVTSKPLMLDKPFKVNPLGVFSHVTSTFDISSAAINTTSDDIICRDDKKSHSLKSAGALISQSNIVCGRFQKNVKPGNSAAPSNQPFTRKAASIPSKHATKGVSISCSVSRQFSWRNELTHGKTALSSTQTSPVTTFSKKSLATIPAKPRTWHRTDNLAASNTIVKKPSSSTALPQRLPYGKSLRVQDTSYIRKGNSIVRNIATSTTAFGPHALNASVVQEKPIDINKNGTVKGSGSTNCTESSDFLITGGRHTPIEMPKIPPLPCTEKTSDCKIAYMGDSASPLQVERLEGMDNRVALKATENASSLSENLEIVLDQSFEDAGNSSDGVVQASNVKKVVYIKRKANQLIAASTSPELSGRNMDNKLGLSSDNSYYKRRKNQLIRASSESNIQKMVIAADDSSNSRMQRAFNVYSGRSASKGPSSRVKSSKVSLVWKLGDAKSSDKGSAPLRSKPLRSHLLPWKRTTYRRSVWRASASSSNCSSLIKTRKLLTSRNRAVVYVRSGRGFSLRRSKVISLAGSLKWSKSMEKRSKKIDAEAALAVTVSNSTAGQKTAASGVSSETGIKKPPPNKSVLGLKLHPGERIFRVGLFRYRMDPSRRTLQRIPDEEASDSTTSKTEKYARKSYMPKRLLIGSDEYVRIGNGNQLVRDPKRRTRILASEKVRWSLHTARLRLSKKRKFCQFFTRFGRCNKSEGKCPYIHDSSKITVCTKFLKGLCADPNCKLTHKVIPDRMPDCSFFLQGLCSNESCPYRHVNVNPKASICESFLRGYCSEGNECRKKHSYLCPEFEATGSCPQGSKCKLYHPKKGMSKKEKISEDQRNIRGRYFDPGLTATVAEPENETAILEKDVAPKNNGVSSEGDLGDYISLDVSDDDDDDDDGESIYLNSEVTYLSEVGAPKNSGALSGGDLADYINLDDELGENTYPNREVMYLSEFDALNYL